MTDNHTGPEWFQSTADELVRVSTARAVGSTELRQLRASIAQVGATQANTAALVMLAGIIANATGQRDADLEGWAKVIPPSPLTECWSQNERRPECTPRHTDDCYYSDPVPKPKHKLLAVGTRVLVSDNVWDEDEGRVVWKNPQPGRISGYDTSRTKYRWQYETSPGRYLTSESWAFVDDRVVVHPDGPECPPAPEPVKQEPTGPVLYVQRFNGQQGRVLDYRSEHGRTRGLVRWFEPGAEPVWIDMNVLAIIASDEVDRCPNGQTRDECESGENQCEPCLQAEDEEGDEIERSMGLRKD